MRKEPDVAQQFASMLEALRTEHQMTATEIARETGLSRPTIYRLINGEGRQVSYDVGDRIERLFRARRK